MITKYVLVFALLSALIGNGCFKKQFELIEVNLEGANDTLKTYRIFLRGQKIDFSYPFQFGSNIDTVAAIGELLEFEGDERICALPIRNYNPRLSTMYVGEEKKYSIQLEALFLINQLIMDDPFSYSPFPILINTVTGEVQTRSGKTIATAFHEYKKWYEIILKNSSQLKGKVAKLPLTDSNVRWFQ